MIWEFIARFVLKYRFFLLSILLLFTLFMGYQASKLEMSYEFSKAIPIDNPKYLEYQAFRQKFGEDGNLLVIGIQTSQLFDKDIFNDYIDLSNQLKGTQGID
jgi:predicted RND superfamily exporter protein